jgi:hypothetical protein
MSLRYEQYHSLKKTQQFLRELLDKTTRPKTVRDLKKRALSCLRHYPFLHENGEPMFSRDDFTTDKSSFCHTIFDPNELVHAAFRYFLGRRTISANAFARDLARAVPVLSKPTREMIAQELRKAFEKDALGHKCDVEAWTETLSALEQSCQE